ncbi:hypothetical protein GLOIN_2v1886514 [Rhizophagus clarus]|uniref:Myb-like domain-containing protein n=1 Tax=Rhizophagus clarus TaxID=94130 RepID=A0A8H3R5E9_9GLOM|nr:hypothetical protein GLOIN_2v1886514 [Rhizophagus clarus]
MPLFNDDENKRIKYRMRMWGHLDDCFVLISNEMPRFTPKQISDHWENFLNPQFKNIERKINIRRKLDQKKRNKRLEPRTAGKFIKLAIKNSRIYLTREENVQEKLACINNLLNCTSTCLYLAVCA